MTLDHLRVKPELFRQLSLLERLSRALELSTSCLGAAVGGSLATDRADFMSDVDLVVYCQVGHAETLLGELSTIAQSLPAVYRLTGKHDERSVFEKVVLEDWSSYEIHVIEPTTRMRLKSPYLEITNREGYLATRVSEEKVIGRETVKPFSNGDSGLFWELFNCMKWLRRNETCFAREYLQRLGNALATQGSCNET